MPATTGRASAPPRSPHDVVSLHDAVALRQLDARQAACERPERLLVVAAEQRQAIAPPPRRLDLAAQLLSARQGDATQVGIELDRPHLDRVAVHPDRALA